MNQLLKQWIVVALATGAAIFALSPVPTRSVNALGAGNEGWVVPRVVTPSPQTPNFVKALQQSALWGAQADQTNTADSRASQWRLAGITGSARDRVVIVQFGDERILPVKVGEKFPDGTPVAEIRENGVCVTLSGKRRFLPISGQTIPLVW
jgi:hypothetical protein